MIEILENKRWNQTGWRLFKELEESSFYSKNIELDKKYNYIITIAYGKIELYRQRKVSNKLLLELEKHGIIRITGDRFFSNCAINAEVTLELNCLIKELKEDD